MNYEELIKMLGIDDSSEFEYFENFADLVECSAEVEEEALYKLFGEADRSAVVEITENYFEEIMDAVPDDSTDIYTLLETIKMSLIGLCEAAEDEKALVHFCEELNNFRQWYCNDSEVECKNSEDGNIELIPLRDAIALSRIERLEGDKYRYDFSNCMDYEIEEYIMSYADMAVAARDENSNDDMFEESYDDYDENIYDR